MPHQAAACIIIIHAVHENLYDIFHVAIDVNIIDINEIIIDAGGKPRGLVTIKEAVDLNDINKLFRFMILVYDKYQ